ncbi:hypothetical protein [Janthinobacterium sp. HLX7-2]|uniref:hypothetical protein n=1 Tax=Janthinobacterium sp. HLX7-2 TaxID=1259331 RepID=UPI003F252517
MGRRLDAERYALQDWLLKGHLAYFIIDTVHSLDLSRGLSKGQAEWELVCKALNLQRRGEMLYA